MQADTLLFLAGFINDDEAPVVGPDVNRPVDAVATTREIPDTARETCDASSKRGQELCTVGDMIVLLRLLAAEFRPSFLELFVGEITASVRHSEFLECSIAGQR